MSNKVIPFIEFGKIAEFRNGLNFSKSSHGTGCLLVGVTDFQKNFTPNYDSLEEINPDGITKNDDYLKKGDILFVRSNGNKALVGRSLYIDRDINALFSGFCIRARIVNEIIDPLFLAYFTRTKHFKSSISFVAGTNINNLNQDILNNVKLPAYPKDIQSSITNILSALDPKIELNNRINAELEAMAKTLYDYWFVQFDFPDQHGKPYKTSGGKMVWNEELKREIPDGWEAKPLFEGMDVQYGFPFSTTKFTEEITDKPIIRIRDILENTISIYTTEDVDNKYRLNRNDLLIGMDGNFHLNFWDKQGAYLNQRCVRIRSRSSSTISNLQAYFELSPYIKAKEKNISRTTVGHLSDKDLKRLFVTSSKVTDSFHPREALDALLEKMTANRLQNKQLAELRDWLLPMLMNGQVSVAEIAKKPEAKQAMAAFTTASGGISRQNAQYDQTEILYATVWANLNIGVKQGDMATSKDTYLLDRVSGIETNFNFARHNWGAFDPLEKRLLNDPQYFHKVNFPHSQAHYIDLKDNGSLLEKIPAELKEQISNGIKEMNDKVFGKYFGKQKAEMKELYATVLMCIEDKQSLLLNEIRSEMASWNVTQGKTEMTKAEKFSEAETQEALEVIIKENWYKNVLISV